MSLKVKNTTGPYLFTFDMHGVKDTWGGMGDEGRRVWWRAFWASMKANDSMLTESAFAMPGDSGESSKKGSIPSSDVSAIWNRNKSPDDLEDFAIQGASLAAFDAARKAGHVPSILTTAGSDVLLRPPILGIEPQDIGTATLLVDATKAAVKETVSTVTKGATQAAQTAGQVAGAAATGVVQGAGSQIVSGGVAGAIGLAVVAAIFWFWKGK